MVSLSLLCLATLAGCSGTVAGPQSSADDASHVALTPSSLSLQPGETARIVAELQNPAGAPVNGAHVRWVSNDTNVARVDDRGRVTGVAPGATRVTASLGEGRGRVQVVCDGFRPEYRDAANGTSAFPGAQGWGAQACRHVTVRTSRFFGSPIRTMRARAPFERSLRLLDRIGCPWSCSTWRATSTWLPRIEMRVSDVSISLARRHLKAGLQSGAQTSSSSS